MVGLPMVENCLSGYNSCMFAYGQVMHQVSISGENFVYSWLILSLIELIMTLE